MSRYNITSIERITPPAGAIDKHWYQYVIENNYNTITSKRSGSEREIRKFATETIQRLNEKYLTRCKVKNYNRTVNEISFSNVM